MVSYHYLIKNKNYDFYLSILISESWAPFFGQPPVEILAASFALETFAKSSKDNHVQLMINNTTAVSSINHVGTSHSDMSLTHKEIWEWCIPRGIWISAANIPRKQNTVAELRNTLGPAFKAL